MSDAIFPVVLPGVPAVPPAGPDELAADAGQLMAQLSVLPGRALMPGRLVHGGASSSAESRQLWQQAQGRAARCRPSARYVRYRETR